jgi:hypothetical protein
MAILRNEQDVREEIATPFLKALGYESRTANDIVREHRLRYAAMQLGRKKQNDVTLPQGGDADYMLTVAGAGRWILETKPPDQEITSDDIDQAASYARHPEVSGHYAAVLNGRRFVLYYSSQTSNDEPLIDLKGESGDQLAQALAGLLSPLAIRRDCARPKVDLRTPLAPGYRGEAALLGGWNKQLSIRIDPKLQALVPAVAELQMQYKKLVGMQSILKDGTIWRDRSSRLRARVSWHPPHEEMRPLLEAAHLDQFEYVCLGETISTNSEKPSVFEILGSYESHEGQVVYDLLQWKSQALGFDASTVIQGQATRCLVDDKFEGIANFSSTTTVRNFPFPIVIHFLTEFSFTVDKR